MSSNYLNSSGTSIFSDAGSYWNNIIGIGRDDAQGLYQKQSRTVNDSIRLYRSLELTNQMNTSTITNTPSYVVLGGDQNRLCSVFTSSTYSEKPAGIRTRLAREWKIYNTNFSDNYSIDIKLNSCALPATFNTTYLRLLVDDDGNFTNASAYASGTSGITITYSNPVITISGLSTTLIPLNGFRYITIGSTNALTPLPVELVSFHSACENGKIELSWTTASERNNDYFNVERSTDAINWITVGTNRGAGNSVTSNNYFFMDTAADPDFPYYRLKQVDFDGDFSYSNVIIANCEQNLGMFILSPNPTTGYLTISNAGNISAITIKDITGRIIKHYTIPTDEIDLSTLKPGMYYISIRNNQGFTTQKVIKE